MFASMVNIEPENASQTIEVACGVIVGDDGEVLLAQRPPGKLAGGKWEFPGGKIEVGESAAEALGREMDEDLGIRVEAATFLARLRQSYHGRMVLLDTWRIDAYEGRPVARELQKLAWVPPARVLNYDVLPSCWRVLAALQLPQCYVFTPADQALECQASFEVHIITGSQIAERRLSQRFRHVNHPKRVFTEALDS